MRMMMSIPIFKVIWTRSSPNLLLRCIAGQAVCPASGVPVNQMLRHLNRYNLSAGADFPVG